MQVITALYRNDRPICRVRYEFERADQTAYSVRISVIGPNESDGIFE